METEIITTYGHTKNEHFVDTMDGTFRERGDHNGKEINHREAPTDMDESHTDDEEDVPLNLDCSKSDDDDLGESEHEASDNEEPKNSHDKEEDSKITDSNKEKIVTCETKKIDENINNAETNGDGQETAKKEANAERDGTQESMECNDNTEVDSTDDQNMKDVIPKDTSSEKKLDHDKSCTTNKDKLQTSDDQTKKDESGKDIVKDISENIDCSESKKEQVNDKLDESDKHETKDYQKESVTDAEAVSIENKDSKDAEDVGKGKNDGKTPQNNDKSNAENESKEDSEKNDKEGGQYSLLKETLSKPTDDTKEQENNEEIDEDFDPSDFDPSLLCPEVAMEVEEAPVISSTNDQNPQNNDDGAKSPILFDAVFSTYVDEMTGTETCFDLTPEEDKLRQDTYGQKNPVQFTKVHCTACNVHLGSALDGQGNRFVHPLLKVLICKNCYFFYSSGEFERDEDGSELYCRWCGQGGQVMCCSQCEMVFCKKCIRINFDRKKIADIRDSDDWLCFRCNPSQITHLKIHCAEFMEYVRRERSRAATLENYASITNTDYALCCQSLKKKATDSPADAPKRKRRKVVVDPDYNPLKDEEDDEKVIEKVPHTVPLPTDVNASSSPQITLAPPRVNGVPSTPTIAQHARPAVPPYSPKTPQQSNIRPKTPIVVQNASSRQTQGPTTASSPGYIKILPGGVVVPGNTPRQMRMVTPRPQTTMMRPQTPTQTMVRPKPQSSAFQSQTKHEWFEKTVRAAARVNSNLSYTLTNLNRAQAAATSVEALAVVHNKLQEILSTSINSLIQIRKNLRAEFIQGIKNARFPPKPQPPATTNANTKNTSKTSDQDDDVIIISPASSPLPSVKIGSFASRPSTSRSADSDKTGGRPFLRVKSLTALQNVPAECITIPDDPPEIEKPTEVAIDAKKKGLDSSKVIKVDITKILAGGDPIAVESSSSKKEKSKEAGKENAAEDVIPVSAPECSKVEEKQKQSCKNKDKAAVENCETALGRHKPNLEEGKTKDRTNVEKMPNEKESQKNDSEENRSEEKESEGRKSDEKEVVSEEESSKTSSNRSSPALKTLQDVKVILERSKEIEGCVTNVTKNQKTD